MARFWNYLHQVHYAQKIGKPNNLKVDKVDSQTSANVAHAWWSRTLVLLTITLFRNCRYK